MTDKELKKLSRAELLQMLIDQSKQVEELQAELEEARQSADAQKIELDDAGNIAEAALKINHVFEDAQAAAQQYLDNIQALNARQEEVCAKREKESREQIDQMLSEAQEKEKATLEKCKELREETVRECKSMEQANQEKCRLRDLETEEKCRQLEKETTERCQELVKDTQDRCTKQIEEAKEKSESYWNEVVAKLESYMKEREGLQTLLSGIGISK